MHAKIGALNKCPSGQGSLETQMSHVCMPDDTRFPSFVNGSLICKWFSSTMGNIGGASLSLFHCF
jgi:hypothetical protein